MKAPSKASPAKRQAPFWRLLANRRDGFGARLSALLNAMMLAEHTKGSFFFAWDHNRALDTDHHALSSMEETFSSEFIENHGITEKELLEYDHLPIAQLENTPEDQQDIIAKKSLIVVDSGETTTRNSRLCDQGRATQPLMKLFSQITFSPKLEAARHLANSTPLAGTKVAVHLRAGDIVYGKYRFTGSFTSKVCPYPWAEEIIRQSAKDNISVIVFGQDLELCQYFRDTYGAVLAADLVAGAEMSNPEQALFDICLMGRCDKIYAGSSYFSSIAAKISGAEVIDPYRHFRSLEAIDILEEAALEEAPDPRISPLQQAAACWTALRIGRERMSLEQERRFIDKAILTDPENLLYAVYKAHMLYREGEDAAAEDFFLDHISANPQQKIDDILLKGVGSGGSRVLPQFMEILTQRAEARLPMAALCAALCMQRMGNTKAAKSLAATFRQDRSSRTSALRRMMKDVTAGW